MLEFNFSGKIEDHLGLFWRADLWATCAIDPMPEETSEETSETTSEETSKAHSLKDHLKQYLKQHPKQHTHMRACMHMFERAM